jgi:hypothetical protein
MKVLRKDVEKNQTQVSGHINKMQVQHEMRFRTSVYCPKIISNKRPELESAIDTQTLFSRFVKGDSRTYNRGHFKGTI